MKVGCMAGRGRQGGSVGVWLCVVKLGISIGRLAVGVVVSAVLLVTTTQSLLRCGRVTDSWVVEGVDWGSVG